MADSTKILLKQGILASKPAPGGNGYRVGDLLFANYTNSLIYGPEFQGGTQPTDKQGDIYLNLDNSTQIKLANDVDRARTLFAGTTSTTAANGQWTANIQGVDYLYDGLTIALRVVCPVNATANFLKVNNTPSKLIWFKTNTRLKDQIETYTDVILTYHTTQVGSDTVNGVTYTDGWVLNSGTGNSVLDFDTGTNTVALKTGPNTSGSLQFIAGSNITLTPAAGKITIEATNSRDKGYGIIYITGSSSSDNDLTATTDVNPAANVYNDYLKFSSANKWIKMSASNVSGNGSTTSMDEIKIAHALSLTSGIAGDFYGLTADTTPALGPTSSAGTFKVPKIKVDMAGHVTEIGEQTVQMPDYTDSRDSGYGKIFVVGSTNSASANNDLTATTNVNPAAGGYNDNLKLSTANQWIKMSASNSTSVRSDTSMDEIKIAHALSLTSGTAGTMYGLIADATPALGTGSFNVPKLKVDMAGHVVEVGEQTITMPDYTNSRDNGYGNIVITGTSTNSQTGLTGNSTTISAATYNAYLKLTTSNKWIVLNGSNVDTNNDSDTADEIKFAHAITQVQAGGYGEDTQNLTKLLGQSFSIPYISVDQAGHVVEASQHSVTVNAPNTLANGYAIEYIKGTQAASTGVWTGVTKDSALYDGKMIMYVLPYEGNGDASLKLTLANGTDTGNVPIYRYGGTTRINTHYSAGSRILLIYDATNNRWNSSAWYNTDTNTLQRTYALSNNADLPITLGAQTTSGAWSTNYTSDYKDLYGVIPSATANRPTINPSTGVMKVPAGITANLTGNITGNVTGNVTGDVTGNASTATKWAAAVKIKIGETTHNLQGGETGDPGVSWTIDEILGASNTDKFYRGDKYWGNTLVQTSNASLGLNTSTLLIGKGTKNFGININTAGSGSSYEVGSGLTFGYGTTADTAYAGLYAQMTNSGSKLYLGTTNNYTNGVYARVSILHDGKVGIGTVAPSQLLHINGGLLNITNNSNTVTIGSNNTSYCHFSNSANIPFYFNKSIWVEGDLLPYGDTNTKSLGSTSKRWKTLYIGTADSYGGQQQPIYWNNGVPTALTYTQNKLYYASDANTFAPVTHTYIIESNSKAYLTINGTSTPANSGNFQVVGTSTLQNILSETDSTYNIGSTGNHWKTGYFDNLIVSTDTGYTATTSNKSGTSINTGSIEMSGTTPYIDFHRANSTEDYTARIINDAEATIKITGTAGSYTSGRTITPTLFVNGNSYTSGDIIGNGDVVPLVNDAQYLGTYQYRWKSLYVKEFAADLHWKNQSAISLSQGWIDVGIEGDMNGNSGNQTDGNFALEDGTYIIQLKENNVMWSGVLTWDNAAVNSATWGNYSEISLHGAGANINSDQIFLRTVYATDTTKGQKLQISHASSTNRTIAVNGLEIKMKKII